MALAGAGACAESGVEVGAGQCGPDQCGTNDSGSYNSTDSMNPLSREAEAIAEVPKLPLACGGPIAGCSLDDIFACEDRRVDGGVLDIYDYDGAGGYKPVSDSGALLDAATDAATDAGERDASDVNDTGAVDAGVADVSVSTEAGVPVGSGRTDAGAPHYASQSWQLTVREGTAQASCQIAGRFEVGEPCVSGAECAAGLACVDMAGQGPDSVGKCLPTCCEGPDVCGEGSYCGEAVLRGTPEHKIPVCVVAEACNLAEPYPCPVGEQCTCTEGTVCSIVNAGVTACVPPGPGQEGESCPCAAGYLCSQSSDVCLRLCDTKDTESLVCGTGQCQRIGDFTDVGVCVGSTAGLSANRRE